MVEGEFFMAKKEIKYRKLNKKKMRKILAELKKALDGIEKAKRVSRKCLETRIMI